MWCLRHFRKEDLLVCCPIVPYDGAIKMNIATAFVFTTHASRLGSHNHSSEERQNNRSTVRLSKSCLLIPALPFSRPRKPDSVLLSLGINLSVVQEMSETDFNFSPVSWRDRIGFGSGRPGFPSKEVSKESLKPWIEFMKKKGIVHVLSFLGDDELDYYKCDIDEEMRNAFGEGKYIRTSIFAPNSKQVILDAIDAAHKAAEPIVMHCSGGEGRTSIGMCMWLVHVHKLSPEEAAEELKKETEALTGIVRRVSAEKVTYLISNGTMAGFQK